MKIREFLTEANWGKGVEMTTDNKECLLSALGHCYKLEGRILAERKIRGAIGGPVMDWNDAPERTFAEVKALVERLDV